MQNFKNNIIEQPLIFFTTIDIYHS